MALKRREAESQVSGKTLSSSDLQPFRSYPLRGPVVNTTINGLKTGLRLQPSNLSRMTEPIHHKFEFPQGPQLIEFHLVNLH